MNCHHPCNVLLALLGFLLLAGCSLDGKRLSSSGVLGFGPFRTESASYYVLVWRDSYDDGSMEKGPMVFFREGTSLTLGQLGGMGRHYTVQGDNKANNNNVVNGVFFCETNSHLAVLNSDWPDDFLVSAATRERFWRKVSEKIPTRGEIASGEQSEGGNSLANTGGNSVNGHDESSESGNDR